MSSASDIADAAADVVVKAAPNGGTKAMVGVMFLALFMFEGYQTIRQSDLTEKMIRFEERQKVLQQTQQKILNILDER